jgi:hypothetical protein
MVENVKNKTIPKATVLSDTKKLNDSENLSIISSKH